MYYKFGSIFLYLVSAFVIIAIVTVSSRFCIILLYYSTVTEYCDGSYLIGMHKDTETLVGMCTWL